MFCSQLISLHTLRLFTTVNHTNERSKTGSCCVTIVYCVTGITFMMVRVSQTCPRPTREEKKRKESELENSRERQRGGEGSATYSSHSLLVSLFYLVLLLSLFYLVLLRPMIDHKTGTKRHRLSLIGFLFYPSFSLPRSLLLCGFVLSLSRSLNKAQNLCAKKLLDT